MPEHPRLEPLRLLTGQLAGGDELQATSVLGVGFDPGYLARFFTNVRLISRLDNHLEVNNDEQLACDGSPPGSAEAGPHPARSSKISVRRKPRATG